jgi:hypothetical protein
VRQQHRRGGFIRRSPRPPLAPTAFGSTAKTARQTGGTYSSRILRSQAKGLTQSAWSQQPAGKGRPPALRSSAGFSRHRRRSRVPRVPGGGGWLFREVASRTEIPRALLQVMDAAPGQVARAERRRCVHRGPFSPSGASGLSKEALDGGARVDRLRARADRARRARFSRRGGSQARRARPTRGAPKGPQSSCGRCSGAWDSGRPERRAIGPESRGPPLRRAPLGLNGSQIRMQTSP